MNHGHTPGKPGIWAQSVCISDEYFLPVMSVCSRTYMCRPCSCLMEPSWWVGCSSLTLNYLLPPTHVTLMLQARVQKPTEVKSYQPGTQIPTEHSYPWACMSCHSVSSRTELGRQTLPSWLCPIPQCCRWNQGPYAGEASLLPLLWCSLHARDILT